MIRGRMLSQSSVCWRLVSATSTGYKLLSLRTCVLGVRFVKVAVQPAIKRGRKSSGKIFFNMSGSVSNAPKVVKGAFRNCQQRKKSKIQNEEGQAGSKIAWSAWRA